MKAVEIRKDIYWVGAIDWSMRSFHGYETSRGSSYNAYLILDEKITLIDTVKEPFKEELLERVASVIDPAKIDYIISNHVEPDHSGALPFMMAHCPNATIITSIPQGLKGLKARYGDMTYEGVKAGDTLSIGKRTLTFVATPMVHWPDNMVTYDAYDKILFSNDAFGQHYATAARFDDENDIEEALRQARKYYANIVQPYRMQAANAVKAVRSLGPDAIDLIAPAHGIIWRSYVKDILDAYENVFVSGKLEDKALIAYDSMWGSTDKIAHAICDGFLAEGVSAHLMDLKANHLSDAMDVFLDSRYVAVGSPTLNSNMMPLTSSFLTYMRGLSPKQNNGDRIGFAFGSYGWAPLGPKNIQAELEADGFQTPEAPFMFNWIPTQEYLDQVREKVRAVVRAQREA